ncbi:unnamed protein product [Linum tenue]|uniref:ParB/Sulfiredoxin domain-containing protein n=1 Tax=Linum tenue TaxID=586396 RepID=A0AAV0JD71_9ROSI|nr:unnamed protein product [Linum tenue]
MIDKETSERKKWDHLEGGSQLLEVDGGHKRLAAIVEVRSSKL